MNESYSNQSSSSDDSSSSDEEVVLTLLLACRSKRKRRRTVWVREIFTKRREQGDFHHLIQEMRLHDLENHFRYFRMSKERFDSLLSKV